MVGVPYITPRSWRNLEKFRFPGGGLPVGVPGLWPLSTLGVDGLPGRHSDNFLAQWGVAVLLCSLGQSQPISDVG